MCAVGGLARPADGSVGVVGRSESPVKFVLRACKVGTREGGEFRRRAAPGHPHSYSEAGRLPPSGEPYAGNEMFAWVARQERMWKGESIEISKCLRLPGSFTSGFDNRMTIWTESARTHNAQSRLEAYLDPVMHLNVLICGIKVQSLASIPVLHSVTTGQLHAKLHLSWSNGITV